MRHSTDSYIGWLRTDSLVNGLDPDARSGFLHDIEELMSCPTTEGPSIATSSTR